MTPFGTGPPILADGEAEFDLLGSVPPGVLVALLGVAFLLVVLGVVTGVLLLRRARRSSLGQRGRELAQSGLFSVGAMALPSGRRDLAALGGRVNGARNELAREFQQATAAGRYVGTADVLVPRLVSEGDQLLTVIQRLAVAGGAAGGKQSVAVTAEGEDYIRRVQPLLEALRAGPSSAAAPTVTADEVDDAVAGLRASGEAYREFMTAPDATTPIGRAQTGPAEDDTAPR